MSVRALTWALRVRVGNPTRKLILLTLADASNDDGESWPSQARLAEVSEVSERSVRTHLRDLEADGLVERSSRFKDDGGRTSDLYRLPLEESAGGPWKPTSGGRGSQLPVAIKEEPSLEPKDSHPPEISAGGGDPDRGFERLWKLLRRGSKKKARDQYRKKVPAIVSEEDIEAGLRWYVIAYRVGKRNGSGEVFEGAHLERWIRDHRWEEMPAEARRSMMRQGDLLDQSGGARFYE